MLARLAAKGERVRVKLAMEAHFLPEAESANVVAELRGSELPDEIVLVCGHLDSWDVGQGAHDDGGGCMVAWEAVRTAKRLGLRPRRTLRVVLYTNEENGVGGGKA
jgi:carboxypeptidase Q